VLKHVLPRIFAQVVLWLETQYGLIYELNDGLHWLRKQWRWLLNWFILQMEIDEILLNIATESILFLWHNLVKLVDWAGLVVHTTDVIFVIFLCLLTGGLSLGFLLLSLFLHGQRLWLLFLSSSCINYLNSFRKLLILVGSPDRPRKVTRRQPLISLTAI